MYELTLLLWHKTHTLTEGGGEYQRFQEVEQGRKGAGEGGVLINQHLNELNGQVGRVEPTGQLLQQTNLDLQQVLPVEGSKVSQSGCGFTWQGSQVSGRIGEDRDCTISSRSSSSSQNQWSSSSPHLERLLTPAAVY